MGLGPILPGRLPPSLTTSRLKYNLQESNTLLANLQQQVATGQKFFFASESPTAAVRSIYLQKEIELNKTLQANVRSDKSFLSASEQALGSVNDALNEAKTLLLAGVGTSISSSEREALAVEVASLIKSVVNAGNTKFQGRYLFAGSESQKVPFEILGDGTVRYNGDDHQIQTFADNNLLLSNNIDGSSAFRAFTSPVGTDVNPALTLNTRLDSLDSGAGISPKIISITVDDGINPIQTAEVDLSGARKIGDIKALIENAFAGGPPTITVDVDPTSKNGIRLTPSAGTVAVSDVAGSQTAKQLGIASAAAASITGSDLDPILTNSTLLADFNGGAGIGTTAGNGLKITNGQIQKTIDISSAVTVEDLFNIFKRENLDLATGINEQGNGLSISSRLSGANFSIGENNGSNASGLGIRTFDGDTLLSDLNLGLGVPVDKVDQSGNLLPAPLIIERRDGSQTTVELKGLKTIQQVIDAITAVDPNLTASLNTTGNGISIVDTSGAGPLTVVEDQLSIALGLNGSETGAINTVPLTGSDPNPIQTNGVFGILVDLEVALRTNNATELERLDKLIGVERDRVNAVRGDLGARLQTLEKTENRLLDQEVGLEESLSLELGTDLTEAITQISLVTSTLQATLQIAGQTLQLSLLNFL